MGCCNFNFTTISSYLLPSPLCLCSIIATSSDLVTINRFQDVCALVNCRQGTCKASNASVLGFVCDCHLSWRKIQIGPFTFPSCLLLNCTVDFHCGNGSRSPSPPSSLSPILPPSTNLFSPCGLVWCGDGTCVTNGTGYACQCNQGSENLLNSSNLACFKHAILVQIAAVLALTCHQFHDHKFHNHLLPAIQVQLQKDQLIYQILLYLLATLRSYTPSTNLPNVVVEMIISNQSAPSSQSS